MRIVLIIYGSLETLSGGYLYDRQLVEHLRAAGHHVECVSLPWRNYARHLLDNLDGRVLRQIERLAPDLVVEDELNHPSLVWLNRRLRRRVHAPIVSIVHHLRTDEEHPALLLPLYGWVEGAYLRSVDGFIWNSKTTRSNVLHLRGSGADGVVAYPGTGAWATQATTGTRLQPQRPATHRLLFVGNVIPRKRLDVLLRALQNAPRVYTLDVVGSLEIDRVYARQMQALARSLHVEERVRFHGKLADDELAARMEQTDLLVVPSFEGFGIVYLEAMAFGVPVVAATAGAAREIVRDRENGYLVPLGNAAEITRILHRLHGDPALLASLRKGARETFARFPSWQTSGALIEEWLLEFVTTWQSKDGQHLDH